jgi:hypothetical protein
MKQAFARGGALLLGAALLVAGCGDAPPPTAAAAAGRPAGAGQGPAVAVVVARRGEVTVHPREGSPYPAAPGSELLRDDRLVTGAGGMALVELYNGHVARLGADLGVTVAKISGFDEPPARGDLLARALAVLDERERDDAELRGAITRVAGWSSRMTGAETIAPLPVRSAPAAPVTPPPQVGGAGGAAEVGEEAGRGAAPLADPGAAQIEVKNNKGTTRRPADPGVESVPVKPLDSRGPEADGKATGRPVPPAGEAAGEATTAPDASRPEAKKQAGPELRGRGRFTPEGGEARSVAVPAAIDGAALAACAGAGAEIRVVVAGGKISAVEVDGAARCGEGRIGRQIALADGVLELRVSP